MAVRRRPGEFGYPGNGSLIQLGYRRPANQNTRRAVRPGVSERFVTAAGRDGFQAADYCGKCASSPSSLLIL